MQDCELREQRNTGCFHLATSGFLLRAQVCLFPSNSSTTRKVVSVSSFYFISCHSPGSVQVLTPDRGAKPCAHFLAREKAWNGFLISMFGFNLWLQCLPWGSCLWFSLLPFRHLSQFSNFLILGYDSPVLITPCTEYLCLIALYWQLKIYIHQLLENQVNTSKNFLVVL